MSNDNKAFEAGRKDASYGKGPSSTYGKSDSVAKSYTAGYQTAKQSGSGKSGK